MFTLFSEVGHFWIPFHKIIKFPSHGSIICIYSFGLNWGHCSLSNGWCRFTVLCSDDEGLCIVFMLLNVVTKNIWGIYMRFMQSCSFVRSMLHTSMSLDVYSKLWNMHHERKTERFICTSSTTSVYCRLQKPCFPRQRSLALVIIRANKM